MFAPALNNIYELF